MTRHFLYMNRTQAREYFAAAFAYASRHHIAMAWGTLYGNDGKPCRECVLRVRQWRSRLERCTRCGLRFSIRGGRLTVVPRETLMHLLKALGPLPSTDA